jgi:hypothetical protein
MLPTIYTKQILTGSVVDPGLDPDPSVRGTDPEPDLALDPDPSIIKQK